MICDEPENCPRGCHCFSQPSRNHLVVNCSNVGLTQLPQNLPYGNRGPLIRKWVMQLSAFLERNSYKVYLPGRDDIPGESGQRQRLSAIDNSRAYVAVLSHGMFEADDNELNYMLNYQDPSLVSLKFTAIWMNYKTDRTRRIAVVNFDNTTARMIDNKFLKAFILTREQIDFVDRNSNVFESVLKKIGPPSLEDTYRAIRMPNTSTDFNAKVKYTY
ncbi:hypothetical protein FSP39_024130 [Pinctada imbricata]|uniref:LRRNT domain-containing protein n=1 Tax=Pinctada imbricata TaxID=66713 RepID=A0AA88YFW2_PINIB|nr:hypothetical protein FSP39_024130 [Pinctada imbricata]